MQIHRVIWDATTILQRYPNPNSNANEQPISQYTAPKYELGFHDILKPVK